MAGGTGVAQAVAKDVRPRPVQGGLKFTAAAGWGWERSPSASTLNGQRIAGHVREDQIAPE